MSSRWPPRLGATLVEVLVVIGVIGLVVSMLIPAIQYLRATADQLACASNLRQVALACQNYHATHGRFPPPLPSGPHSDEDLLSWMVYLLPFLENDDSLAAAFHALQTDPEPLHNPPHRGLATVVKAYVCPTDRRLLSPLTDRFGVTAAFTSYLGVGGAVIPGQRSGGAGPFYLSIPEIHDGTSNTIMIGERPPPESLQAGWWYPGYLGTGTGFRGPNNFLYLGGVVLVVGDSECGPSDRNLGPGRTDNPCDRFHFWSLHGRGSNFAFADGSVRFLGYRFDRLLPALATANGGEPPLELD